MTVQRSGSASEDALLTRLAALEAGYSAAPDEEWRAATRDRLVAMAAVRGPVPDAGGRRAGALRRLLGARRRTRLTAAVAGAALTVAALGGVLAAAQGAGPGDLLYPVKRGGEQTRLALAADGERGSTLLDLAGTRLQEVGELVGVTVSASAAVGPSGGEAGPAADPDTGLLVDTLATMDAQTTQGSAALTSRAVERDDGAAVDELVAWAARQRAGLTGLSPDVPDAARDAVAAAGRLLDDVTARGAALRTALACPAGPATDGTDALGPRPAPCAPVAPPAAPDGTTPTGGPDATSVGSRSSAPASTPPAVPSTSPRTSTPAATTAGAAQSTGSRTPPGTAVPRPTVSAPRPAPPTPTLPSISIPVPSVSLPGVPVPGGTPSSSAAAPSSSGAVVQLPPVPGVRLCVPPVIAVDCRSSGG